MNPSYMPHQGANSQTQPQSEQNTLKPFVPRTHSYFPDMKHVHFKTQRYGVVEPFFCEPVVPGDRVTLRNSLKVNSNPLLSQTLMPIKCKKVNTFVPMNAILPRTWDYIYKNPSQGDDVPDDCNTVLRDYLRFVYNTYDNVARYLKTTIPSGSLTVSIFKFILQNVLLLEAMASNASLPALLGYRVRFAFQDMPANYTIDSVLDTIYSYLFSNIITSFNFTNTNGTTITVYIVNEDDINVSNNATQIHLTPRAALDVLRSHLDEVNEFAISTNNLSLTLPKYFVPSAASEEDTTFNYGALVAYQLSCFQFFVNGKVDSLYSSELWLQAMQGLFEDSLIKQEYFTYNGNKIPYDVLSEHNMNRLITQYNQSANANLTALTQGTLMRFNYQWSILYYLHAFNNALRFGDYFTGARTRALGVDTSGWTEAPVVNDKVSAIDTTKSIIMQRFLNALQKIGNSVEEYRQMLTGKVTPPDFHLPQFISADDEDISSANITNNSNDEQGKIVSRLYSSGANKYEYTLDIDLHGYILGLSYFYIPRCYAFSKRRWFFHVDRYDMFNEMLQNIGDQPVYQKELGGLSSGIFGYQGRNEEYKQTVSIANGAFVDYLRSWIFVSDSMDDASALGLLGPVSEDTIRSNPSEFDRYLQDKTGYSLSHAYHFICEYYNEGEFIRPMIAQPTIL